MPEQWTVMAPVVAKDYKMRRATVKRMLRHANRELGPGCTCEVRMSLPEPQATIANIGLIYRKGADPWDTGSLKRPVFCIPGGYYALGTVTTY